jgi:hypothetical protein
MKRFLVVLVGVAGLLAVAPLSGGAAPPPHFALSPDLLTLTAPAGPVCFPNCDFEFVTVTNGKGRKLVIDNPASFDPASFGDGTSFWDTQAGSCWQSYESLGNPIPGHTSCTIQVGFHPWSTATFNTTMTVTRCTSWHLDLTFGFIVCDTFDGSQSIAVTGTGT